MGRQPDFAAKRGNVQLAGWVHETTAPNSEGYYMAFKPAKQFYNKKLKQYETSAYYYAEDLRDLAELICEAIEWVERQRRGGARIDGFQRPPHLPATPFAKAQSRGNFTPGGRGDPEDSGF